MSFDANRFPENVFELDVSGLSGSEIHDKIDELARDYRLDDAGELYLEMVFQNKDRIGEKREYVRYDVDVLFDFCWAYDHPDEVWYMANLISMGSDVQNAIFEGQNRESGRVFSLNKVIFRGPRGLYEELIKRIRPQEEPEPEERYWLRRRAPHKRGAFFPYRLAKKCMEDDSEEAKWLRDELKRIEMGHPTCDWIQEYQLLIFSSEDDIKEMLKEMELNQYNKKEEFAIKNLCFSTPCIMWALKDQITAEEYEELWHSQSIFGAKTRVNELTKFLREHQYNFVFYYEKGHAKTEYNKKEWTKKVKLQFVNEHWIKPGHIMLRCEGTLRKTRLNSFLQRCIDKGLFEHMSAYELAYIYNNFSYAAYGYVNKSIDDAFDQLEDGVITPAPKSWSVPIAEKKFNPNKNFPKKVIFFDFEADTSGAYHKPFLVSACEIDLNDDGQCINEGKMVSWWGDKCAKKFMDWVRIKFTTSLQKIRLYAYNAKYDLTFILPYLYQIKVCMRQNKFYSLEGRLSNYSKSPKVEIWDAYLLFACSLRDAAKSTKDKGYLKPEQAETIKKEMFPYNAYTYDYFTRHPQDWVNVEDMKVGFMEQDNEGKQIFNQQKYDLFLETLRSTISEDEPWKSYSDQSYEPYYSSTFYNYRQSSLYRQVKNYSDHDHTPGYRFCSEQPELVEYFNYKAYAIFYCEQDVRCLKQIMLNMEDICMGRDTDGIKGQVPFKIHIWNHRTASSIGYDNLLMKAVYQQNKEEQWVPRHDFYFLQYEGRALMQKSIRGGRVMTAQNKVWHFKAENEDYLQDCDACSLYPSTMATILWLTEGPPSLLKGSYTSLEFDQYFTHPWASKDKSAEKKFNDGIVHITFLLTKKKLDIPRLCVKDSKTKLNEWRNFDGEEVDTWVNAKDAWDLIDHQNAVFYWDKAMGFTGERRFELQDCMRNLYAFRMPNKKLGVGNVAKLMMNSSYGKSTMKICDEEVHFIDASKFPAYFKANAYRIRSFEEYKGNDIYGSKFLVKIYKKDTSAAFNMFGSDVLAGSKCLMQRFTSIVEDLAEKKGITPHIYYTDTDSNHILTSLVNEAQIEYIKRYGVDPMGEDIGQFHNDFDTSSFKRGENVKGADESYFLAKKVYCDHLVGDQGSDGFHMRMKGVPGAVIKPEDYKDLYNGKTLHYNLLAGGKVSFAYAGGHVLSRESMTRDIAIKRGREEVETDEEIESDDEMPTRKLPRTDQLSPEF